MHGKERLPSVIAQALEQGATIVTGNHRSARTLQQDFDRQRREVGALRWQPSAIMAWETWTSALWHRLLVEGHAAQMMLSRSQELVVWRTVLESDSRLVSLKTVDSLAEMAAEAWRLTCRYDGAKRLRGFKAASSDTQSFQRWAAIFERVCRAESFFSQSQLDGLLRSFVEAALVSVPERLVLVGFDEMYPARQTLIEAFRNAGTAVSELRIETEPEMRWLAGANNKREELSSAARWIREFLRQQPNGRIAMIVPDLKAERYEIDRVLRETLAPELQDIRAGDERTPYEFSVGRPLAAMPMVASALELIRWSVGAISLDRLSPLLRSPYLTDAVEERQARAEFDAFELRRLRLLRPELSLDGLLVAVGRSKRRLKMQRLIAALRRMQKTARRVEGMDACTHSEWAELIRELLEAAFWGVGQRESSLDFQIRRKWEGALDEMATLDFDGVPVEFAQAVTAVEAIARQTVFAAESKDAPVQVMGPLEAAGSTFDAIWFLRGGELDWPLDQGCNPLLPWPLQRDLGMPGTDVERDGEHSRRMTERIAGSAPTVVFSYSRENADGRQRPSPILYELGLESAEASEIAGAPGPRTAVELELVEDLAQVSALPDEVIRGGARILELQAACGFRAFAEQRLGSTELESAATGMDARESGTVVHKILELFWNAVKKQETLKSMTPEEREDLLDWCIAQSLREPEEPGTTAWEMAYLNLQRERLRRLLLGWLDLEMARKLPFEVKLNEKAFNDVRIGPLRLTVRLDRVDIVEGGEVLIDYKTGPASPSEWLTERPDAPQLPLYAALSYAARLQGVAFGLVRAGEGSALIGYEAFAGIVQKPAKLKETSTLEAQVDRWRAALVALAEEFHRGDASIRPKVYPGTCGRCGQRLLCRLDTTLLPTDAEGGTLEEGWGDSDGG